MTSPFVVKILALATSHGLTVMLTSRNQLMPLAVNSQTSALHKATSTLRHSADQTQLAPAMAAIPVSTATPLMIPQNGNPQNKCADAHLQKLN